MNSSHLTQPAEATVQTAPLIAFRVAIKNGSREVSGFEAMGRDSLAVAEQHAGLCAEGEYVSVMALDRWRAKLADQFASVFQLES
jgi:hypothetical protein